MAHTKSKLMDAAVIKAKMVTFLSEFLQIYYMYQRVEILQ